MRFSVGTGANWRKLAQTGHSLDRLQGVSIKGRVALSYRAFLGAACRKAMADGSSLVDVLTGIIDGALEPALSGGGLFEITTASTGGLSSTQSLVPGSPTRKDVADAAQALLDKAYLCLEGDPSLTGQALCTCVASKLPKTKVNRIRSSFLGMGYTNV